MPLVNPFLGVPVADFVKDGAAALALLVALGQPWDWSSDANDHWWVVISMTSTRSRSGLTPVATMPASSRRSR